ncbi:LysR family transcriptional regulator [Sporomusa termitida]|uniref:Aminoethylphosphonate catabolism associated LysR family transcriptional regulator n=1 Tax=Sporomusa termitida TaxID=2377 RepID=A0A517DYW6_9FIRM|nr:LysR family transcriptional regulator [Sporomusa termitida]QDR82436.1 aminoethylphosphonate catabolism associated LysR family transcriptional regulator [Sporomusa termitida]
MRLEQLRHIIEVAHCKSISLAAERAFISQPALSASITKLEVELGISLFKRTNQGVYPTELGESVIEKALEIVDKIEELKEITKTNALALHGTINVAADPSICNTIMVNALTTFKYRHPNVHVMLKVGESNNILHDVQAGKIDFSIILKTDELIQTKNIHIKELFQDDFIILAGKNSPLAIKKAVSLDTALQQPLVLYNTQYVTNCGLSELLSKHGLLNIAYRFDDFKIIETVVASSTCIAFAPKFMSDYYRQIGSIIPIPINNNPVKAAFVIIRSRNHHLSLVEKEFINTVKSLCSMCEFMA